MKLDQLQKVAEAATPGPWRYKVNPKSFVVRAADRTYVTQTVNGIYGKRADAVHIATFSPPTVLALIAVAKAAEVAQQALARSTKYEDRDFEASDALHSALAALRQHLEGGER